MYSCLDRGITQYRELAAVLPTCVADRVKVIKQDCHHHVQFFSCLVCHHLLPRVGGSEGGVVVVMATTITGGTVCETTVLGGEETHPAMNDGRSQRQKSSN